MANAYCDVLGIDVPELEKVAGPATTLAAALGAPAHLPKSSPQLSA